LSAAGAASRKAAPPPRLPRTAPDWRSTGTAFQARLGYGGSAQGALATGSYRIVPAWLESRNYAISYLDGTLQIDPPRDLSAGFGLLDPLAPSSAGASRDAPSPALAGCGILLPETLVPVDCAPASMPAAR
jgi:hypothetical protein